MCFHNIRGKRISVNFKAVILGSNFNYRCFYIFYWMIASSMSLKHFSCFCSYISRLKIGHFRPFLWQVCGKPGSATVCKRRDKTGTLNGSL